MSYGLNKPNGFQSISNIPQAVYNGQLGGNYRIKSAYPYNIFPGDPVTLGTYTMQAGGVTAGDTWLKYTNDGYIHSLAETILAIAAGGVPTSAHALLAAQVPILGFFVGASFVTQTTLNPIDPASPARIVWQGGTATKGGLDARVHVLEDPMTIYSVQTFNAPGGTGAGAANIGLCYPANFTFTNAGGVPTGGFVDGDFNLGISKAFLDLSAATAKTGYPLTAGGLNVGDGNAGGAPYGFRIRQIDPKNPPYEMSVGATASGGINYNNVYVVPARTMWSQLSSL